MKRKKTLFFLLVVMVLASALCAAWHNLQQFARSPLLIEQETIFTLQAGTGREVLETSLTEQQVISPTVLFQWLLRVEPELAKFKAGTYRLMPGMTVREMLALLASGKEAQFSIRFVEGSRLRDWLETLKTAPYLAHSVQDKTPQEIAALLDIKEAENPEGWLYPDTYLYTAGTRDSDLLLRAHHRMRNVVDGVWKNRETGLPYASQEELLTMASIVEKETAVKEERPQVASVFLNRLRAGMRLQTDTTVIYGVGEGYRGVITRSALDTATPYNTYVIAGLPPTPIAMPSRAALEAAAHPAKTDYLYFMADGKGGHRFTTNLADHNRAVRAYRSTLKDRDEQ
ncbi:endolytic transglycosylase MltG [Candidatus Symbiopectobacterium sp.]|uniref:endolytic transglycosylase MltG n=1 Tax=Candidatus Symbiopectobacterium sp. TaxID=2816440 RepID=UPI0025B92415|nr:endolytic transglycosylase MltG [Candidatus Symbiopectobacterium sp.]